MTLRIASAREVPGADISEEQLQALPGREA
jgi:hypothetical protein